jgi:putative ABC transport system permease protein
MGEYRDLSKRRQFYQQLLERVTNVPGVEAAAATSHLPFGGRTLQQNFRLEGREPTANQNQSLADYRVVTPTFFETMRIPIERGRGFSESDTAKTPIVYVINESFARTYLSGSGAVGQRIRLGYEAQWPGEIVGVVGDVKHRTMEADAVPTIYVSFLQCDPLPSFPIMNYIVRGKGDPRSLTEGVRRELQTANGNQVVFYVRPMAEFLADASASRQFNMLLLGLFAAVAIALSAVGLYGLLSYQVSQRRREIAIRMALGARGGTVLRLVIGQGMRLAFTGLAAGGAGALTLARMAQSLLYGVSATDTLTFLTVAMILAGVALLACFVPARRATKVDPMIALRSE